MKIDYKSKEIKQWLTVLELEAIPGILETLKNDDGKIEFSREIETAACLFDCYHVISATAEIGRNALVYNYYTENSGHLDIYFQITAKDSEYYPRHFDTISVALSDIWSLGGETEDEIRSRCLHTRYSRDE